MKNNTINTRTAIITHRGLDPAQAASRGTFWKESSYEAFRDQLARGCGLEFDVRITSDEGLIIIHDANLKRLTDGTDTREISAITSAELLAMDFGGSHLTTLPQLLEMIEMTGAKGSVSAIHIKHGVQTPESMDLILAALEKGIQDYTKFILFDVKLATASFIRRTNPRLQLALSVAHPNDIARYDKAVGGTLYTVEEALANRDLCDWVWLDEWDLLAPDGCTKKFYTPDVFKQMHEAGLKIALVTPELHATSLGLLGGEAHPDAADPETLEKRFEEIISLRPDAVCTDYPEKMRRIINSLQ